MSPRKRVKEKIQVAITDAFNTRKTVNHQLAVGFNVMVDALFDELETKKDKKNENRTA